MKNKSPGARPVKKPVFMAFCQENILDIDVLDSSFHQ